MQKARRHMQSMLRPLEGDWFHTGSLSVSREYLALPDGPGGFAQNSSCSALLRIPLGHIILRIRNYHPLWLNFPEHSSRNQHATSRSYNPADALPQQRFGLFPVRSPLLGESLDYFLFLLRITALQAAGLSHSEISGSKVICTYPELIAAYHVLHRLREPRHPPDALTFFRRNDSKPCGLDHLLILSAVINC